MTFYEAKTRIVDEERLIDSKSFKKFVAFMALFMIGVCLALNLLILATLGKAYIWCALATIACISIFFTIFKMILEDNNSFITAINVSKFFIVPYIVLIAEYLIFRVLGFIY